MLLPVRWQAITASGILIHHHTYDADFLALYRGLPSPVAGRGGKWKIHYNPHDVRGTGSASRTTVHCASVMSEP
ncbi:hypothetical protein ACWFRJ_42610 [Streptomyces sp. NPDC055239]